MKDEFDALTGVLADEIRMYAHAHGSWLPIDLARNLAKQLRESGWHVTPPGGGS